MFVPDDDIVNQLEAELEEGQQLTKQDIHIVMTYLIEETHRLIVNYKKFLKSKSKLTHFPHIIWILPPTHKYLANNKQREMFCEVVEDIIESDYISICGLRLKKLWDERNGNLYLRQQRRFTPEGFMTYWGAIDSAIKFWDTTFADIMVKKQKKALYKSNAARKHTPQIKSVVSKVQARQDTKTERKQHHTNLVWTSQATNKRNSDGWKWNRKLPIPPPRR